MVWIDYNPTHEFWVNTKIETRDTCVKINSTYLDNRDRETGQSMLTPEQVAEIEANRTDRNWWRIYGEGKTGQLEGLVFPVFEQVDEMPEKADGMTETWGMDYGFTNDPTTLIHCYVDNRKKEIWLDERLYRTGMLNEDIAAVMKQEKIGRAVRVYADSAEPKTNETIRRYGFNIQGSYKATKIAEQLQAMKGYKIYVTKRSLNLIRELRGYVWMRDKNGDWLNEPVDILNHCIDAARYAVFPIIKVHKETHSTLSRT
jgi:phage terminase large subunit